MLTHTPSRAKLPFLIAAWMLVAIIALIGSGLTGTTQAQGTSGVIPSINLDSNEAGQLIITWATPEQAPTDYRIIWANTNLGFPSYSAANEPERGNEYPLVDVNTLTLSDLTPGDSYKVQIRSRYYNADRSVRESSGPWTATTTQRVKNHPPAAPTGLTASLVDHNSLTLTWNNPQDTNITGYRIQRGTDANSLNTIEPNTGSPSTNYTDSTVEPETTYHYAVIALSQDGDGAQSTTSVTTLAEPEETVQNDPPAAPTGLVASQVGHSVLTLTWNDPQDDNITGYRVLRGTEADNLAVINSDTASNATEYEDDTVAPETAYHYAVLARSANGEGAQSDIISATTPAAPKSKEQPRRSGARQDTPIPPVILVSNLSQTANQNATYSRDHGQAFTTGNNSTGYSVTSVTIVSEDPNNDAIPLQICEVDGSVHPTTVCTDLTPPSSYPQGNLIYTVPTNTPLTLDADTTYMLVFKAPSSPTELRVAATSSDGEDAASLTGFSIANAFQWYNTSNTWVIGNFSRAILITITGKVNQTAPGAPTGLSATARGSDEINLSWTAPDSSGGSDITGYKIESSSDAGSNWSNLVADTGNTNTAYQHAGLSSGETRHYRVSAINSVGTSAPSNTANATTATVTDTTAPTVTSITHQDPTSSPTNSDTLTWRVTFSETVESVDPADFVITGTTATLTVTAVTNSVYDVTASGGDLASVNETVTLAFATDQNILDPSDNPLTATTPTGANDHTFELDNAVPTFVSGTANGTLIVLTFSEDLDPNSLPPGEAFDVSALGDFSAPQPVVNSVAIEGTMVTLTVTPAIFTDHTVTVSNNAYDDGMGRVPLKNFAGNAVQPAATVGSYSVTNETPIGPPASLRAEAGDGRVRLVWTTPAGVDLQTAYYQYRYAPGASVPEETGWSGPTVDIFQTTVLLSGLTNGTPHAFEVRAVRGSDVGAAATASATPLTGVCNTPDLGNRREVWSATLTVGGVTGASQTNAGYRRGSYGSLGQNGDRIIIGGASYTIRDIFTIVGVEGDRRRITLTTVDNSRFTPAVGGTLLFHWCSDSSGLTNPNAAGYRASNDNDADWSLYDTRELALSLPPNNDATGTPDITGRALPGQTLTAGMGNTADADGLPQNASDFAWQWIRAADETDTPIQDATSSTYTLTDDDVGKQVKVVMSFTDSLSGVESLTSDAYPSSSTVQRVLVSNIGQTEITENNESGYFSAADSAQEFTTGSNETGYTLSSIDLELTVANTSNFPVVKLFSGSANGTEVATLTAPTNASTEKTTYTFTVPTAITLEGNTSYWVMAETGGGRWHTVGTAEDATPAAGWRITDIHEFRIYSSTGPFSTDALVALMIRVNGTVNKPFLENFRADAGNAQVTLRWDNPEESSITRYQYRQRVTSESAWDPDWTDIPSSGASTTSYTVGNLANWTPYTFQIRAVRGNEPTATSAATATPEGPPSAPRNLVARGQDQGITAWWQTPSAGDEQAPVTSYKVRYRQVGMGTSPWQNLTRANDDRSTTQEINNLTNRQHYEVQVAAVNRVGTGQWASVKATPQPPYAAPPAPTGDPDLTLGTLGLFWDNSPTGNTLWADTCTGLRSFRIIWSGPKGHARGADEWAAHINTNRGAGVVTHAFRETPIRYQEGDEDSQPQHSGYYDMYGTVNFEGNGSLSANVRGRFGETWGTWSPTGSLYCDTTEKPSSN